MSVVRLSVHKNTAWKRKQHACSNALVQAAKTASRMKGTAGYVLVSWNGSGDISLAFNLENEVIPVGAVPLFVYDELTKAIKGG